MSHDQKPARIKLVSNGPGAQLPQAAATALAAGEEAIDNPQAIQPEANTSRRVSLVSMIVFILGCALGGAALAALPHLAS